MPIRRFPLMTAVLCAVVWLMAGIVWAQEYRGRVQGLITDNTGAVVPGAKLTLLNTATGVAASTQSNPSGRYIFDMVPPGQYTLTAEMQGFARFVQQNVPVPVTGDVTVNVTLSVGSLSESVTVTDAPPPLKFNSATVDSVFSHNMVQRLPLPTRNPFALALLEPSLSSSSSLLLLQPYDIWGATGLAAGGTRGNQGELLVDGMPTKMSSASGYAPNISGVQEFSVLQNSTDAEHGASAGTVIALATRTGTNQLHGDVAYVGRNPALNGRKFKDNTVSRDRRNLFDVSAGNPIIKNKLFTFNSYEDWRWKEDLAIRGTQPTDLERQGDFSQTLTRTGLLRPVFDPTTTVLDTATNTAKRQAFAGNRIPSSRIDPTAARMMTHFWKPNRPPDDPTQLNNYLTMGAQDQLYWNYLNRTDWNISDKLRVYGRFSKNFRRNNAPVTGSIAEVNFFDGRQDHNTNLSGDATYTLSANTVIDVRASYGYIDQLFPTPTQALGYEKFAALWGGNDWAKSYYGESKLIRFPRLNIGGKTTYGMNTGWLQYGQIVSTQPKIATSRGRHYMKAGADIRYQRFRRPFQDILSPDFSFGVADTASTYINPNTALEGDGYASFLVGGVSSGSAPFAPELNPRDTYLGLYFQDDLKLTSKITLNLGLRADKDGGLVDRDNKLTRYIDIDQTLPALTSLNPALPPEVTSVRSQYGIAAPNWRGGMVFADSSHRAIYNTSWEFMPRVGAAIQLSSKMSLRVGYARWILPGITWAGPFQSPNGMGGSGTWTVYGYTATTTAQAFLTGKPTVFLNNPFPAGLIPAVGTSLGPYTAVGGSARWNRQEYEPIMSDRFNVSLQRQLPNRIVGDFTWLNHYGTNISPRGSCDACTYWTNLNLVDPRIRLTLKSQLDATAANPFYNVLTPKEIPGVLRNQQRVSISSLLGAYPYYTELQEMGRPGLHNKYNSLQFRATRPMSDGYQFILVYVYDVEKIQQFLGNTLDEFNSTPRYIISPDARHRVNAMLVSELPFGKGRRYFNSLHRAADAVVGGWNFAATYSWRSGSFIGVGDWIMNGNPVLSNRTGNQWFDGAAFSRKTDVYTLRATPVYMAGLTNPGSWNLDTTMSKEFRLTERYRLELRLEAYNATNTWLQPNPRTDVNDKSTFGMIVPTDYPRTSSRYCQYQLRLNF